MKGWVRFCTGKMAEKNPGSTSTSKAGNVPGTLKYVYNLIVPTQRAVIKHSIFRPYMYVCENMLLFGYDIDMQRNCRA